MTQVTEVTDRSNGVDAAISLDDRYDLACRRVLLTGAQALVRLLLTQRARDASAGLRTAGYVSGYRGSPLGTLDLALWKAHGLLDAAGVTFEAGLNEDLAATAVWGTQQLALSQAPLVDGVFALWYGKGPGVDRSGDPIKHGNLAGVHPRGGVLAVFGDDHAGKSSTVAHHSEQAMSANAVPVLYPADAKEILQLGLAGYALSRYSGCWVSMKLVNETAEQTASVDLGESDPEFAFPKADDLMPPEGVHYRGVFTPLRDEAIHLHNRLALVARFSRANRLDRLVFGGPGGLGIVTAGKAYKDVMQALLTLGIDQQRACDLGLGIYKVALIWPFEPQGLREFAQGRRELLFVEEKTAFLEPQAAAILYNDASRPVLTGKQDEAGRMQFSPEALLEPAQIAQVIGARLERHGLLDEELRQRLSGLERFGARLRAFPVLASERRMPSFCSGCPHSTSTRVPEGSKAISGIGCHGMVTWVRPGTTLLGAQMGGEGMSWVGLHRYTETRHMFQNLGDGTYQHSGLLAIRAARASGANITYKILVNDAVAMTGGQPVEGGLDPCQIARQVLAEGVRKVVLVSADPQRWRKAEGMPPEVDIHHRDEMDKVQKSLREVPGCTVLLYEQVCAAEKRRRGKRASEAKPPSRAYIHPAVCEGCGDCSKQSGCLSIEPLETPLGRKRQINQSSCNTDLSCLKGFCPSFITLDGAQPRRPQPTVSDEMPDVDLPPPPVDPRGTPVKSIMIAGIGGTGVVTVGAVLAMAAHLQGKAAMTYDMTGLSQKNGAVYSHLRIAPSPEWLTTPRIGQGEADVVLAFDLLAAVADESLQTLSSGQSRLVGNAHVAPTAAHTDPDYRIDHRHLRRRLEERLSPDDWLYVDASGLATSICGDAVASNMFMVGVAAQRGWLPVSTEAIERAIELNGVQVDMNRRAFAFGRLWVHDPASLQKIVPAQASVGSLLQGDECDVDLDALISDRAARLTLWQNKAWASRYLSLVQAVRDAETRVSKGSTQLTNAVAKNLAKLMSYKDEYEVARLYADPSFMEELKRQFSGNFRFHFHMAPPFLPGRHDAQGRPSKRRLGPWMLPALRVMSKLRVLRGSWLDPFGYTEERRRERALIEEYEADLRTLCTRLDLDNQEKAIARARLPEAIRGYGPVKASNMDAADTKRRELMGIESSDEGVLATAQGVA